MSTFFAYCLKSKVGKFDSIINFLGYPQLKAQRERQTGIQKVNSTHVLSMFMVFIPAKLKARLGWSREKKGNFNL
jgi:hypothetical protein